MTTRFRYRPREPSTLDRERWHKVREEVLRLKGNICAVCKQAEFDDIDHIIPRSEGGDFWNIENLQPICKLCHKIKNRKEISRRNLFPRHPQSKSSLRKKRAKEKRRMKRKLNRKRNNKDLER